MNRDELKEIKDKVLEKILTYTYIKIDQGINLAKKIRTYHRFYKYRVHMKRSEAFLERGRLYQFQTKVPIPIYTKQDIDLYNSYAEKGIYDPQAIKESMKISENEDVFMVVNIKRYRFDYTILHIIYEDRVCGVVLHDDSAMYPWTVFKDVI